VCQHRLGSIPNIKRHLTRHISSTTSRKTFTKQLLDRLETLGITDLKEVTAVPVLALYATRFANLKAIQGYSCSLCLFLTSNYKELRIYLNSRHEIKSSDKQSASLTSLYRFLVILQTFRSNSKNIAYFVTS
jgi:hypothetical protein